MSLNILLADDHAIVREGLGTLIMSILPEAHILQAADLRSVLDQLRDTPVRLAVCDINMPGANHFQMVHSIKTLQPAVKLLILSAYKEEVYAERYLKAGADAYLHKNISNREIQHTILALLNDPTASATPGDGDRKQTTPLDLLSDRELEVTQLLVQGNGILEIANALSLRSTTVSTYKNRIYGKLGITNLPDLIALVNDYSL